jgi:hypothetical protein
MIGIGALSFQTPGRQASPSVVVPMPRLVVREITAETPEEQPSWTRKGPLPGRPALAPGAMAALIEVQALSA